MSDMHVSASVEHRDDGTAIKFEVNVGGRSIVGSELLLDKEPTPGMIAEATFRIIADLERQFSGLLRDSILGVRKHAG